MFSSSLWISKSQRVGIYELHHFVDVFVAGAGYLSILGIILMVDLAEILSIIFELIVIMVVLIRARQRLINLNRSEYTTRYQLFHHCHVNFDLFKLI